MNPLRTMLGLIAALSGLPAIAQQCGDALDGALTADSPGYLVVFRTQPAPIETGRHFAVELIVCPKGSAGAAEAVRVAGFMPEHGHGMNYQAAVTPLGAGRYRAEGLMFHMPGRWDFIFDVRAGGRTERLRRSVLLD